MATDFDYTIVPTRQIRAAMMALTVSYIGGRLFRRGNLWSQAVLIDKQMMQNTSAHIYKFIIPVIYFVRFVLSVATCSTRSSSHH